MRAIPGFVLLLIGAATVGGAQGLLAPGSNMPAWADSVFRASPQHSGYDYGSRTSPAIGIADFDGDGLDDVVFEVKSRDGLQRGLAIIHRIDGSVHILGAGHDVGDGNVEIRNWGVKELHHHKSAILVERADDKNGLLVWDGHDYRWVAS